MPLAASSIDGVQVSWLIRCGLILQRTRVSPSGDNSSRDQSAMASSGACALDHPGACVEAHGPCLNLHWRAAPVAAADMRAFADAALTRLPGYRQHRGAHGIEIRPDGMDKGRAIA